MYKKTSSGATLRSLHGMDPNSDRETRKTAAQLRPAWKPMLKRSLATSFVLLSISIVFWFAEPSLHTRVAHLQRRCVTSFLMAADSGRLRAVPGVRYAADTLAQLGRYRAANRALSPTAGRVVFYGDSITQFWPSYKDQFFPGRPYIGRGIAGQSTAELLWRFQQDVINLHPDTVVLLVGANDILQPGRGITFDQTTRDIQTMVTRARQNGIRVIVCSILPVSGFPQPQQSALTEKIRAINGWLSAFAAEQHLTYVDDYSAMSDPTGSLRASLSVDGIHPNARGYAIMQTLTRSAIDKPE